MTELLDTAEQLPPYVHEIATPDGVVAVAVSKYGGQAWKGSINGHDFLFPLSQAHSIGNDNRLGGNSPGVGETHHPGGTFISVGGGEILDDKGEVVKESAVHGPFGAPWYQYKMALDHDGRRMVLTAGPDSRSDAFFRDGERYSIQRVFETVRGEAPEHNELRITTTLTNASAVAWVPPKMVEHAYLEGGGDPATFEDTAVLLNARCEPVRPEYLARTAPINGNDIDTTLPTSQLGTPGMCAFMPNGLGGHVVLMTASTLYADGRSVPVHEFDIYRAEYSDRWTGVEPVMVAESIEPGQSITLAVSIRTFESLEAYNAALPALLAEHR